jgi:hypothetical protein
MSDDNSRLAKYGEVIWSTSRRDEGSISATGANIVATAVLALADSEQAALVAERDELRAEVERLRGPFRCCKHCPEDQIHDVEPNAHDLPCTICEDTLRVRAEAAEAKMARVEALADECIGTRGGPVAAAVAFAHERRPMGCKCGAQIGDGIDWHWHLINESVSEVGRHLHTVLADAPAEQRAEVEP